MVIGRFGMLQEYSPDLHSISKKSKNHHGEGITLTSIHRSDNTAPQSYNNYSMSNDNTQHAPPPQTQVSNTSRYVRLFVKELEVKGMSTFPCQHTNRIVQNIEGARRSWISFVKQFWKSICCRIWLANIIPSQTGWKNVTNMWHVSVDEYFTKSTCSYILTFCGSGDGY